ncbi:hypothetical protein KIPB_004349 [Kipferlia bialata]|uniref:Uncharacterized protein n=1 Tax=Kipferlia bialata TaxID=797122 RepID=A0A9K3CVK4_9EUKA|nr:hypothetical protein KIPB_004349 [Kipferlia bialata]|eukprot:g4349.t1
MPSAEGSLPTAPQKSDWSDRVVDAAYGGIMKDLAKPREFRTVRECGLIDNSSDECGRLSLVATVPKSQAVQASPVDMGNQLPAFVSPHTPTDDTLSQWVEQQSVSLASARGQLRNTLRSAECTVKPSVGTPRASGLTCSQAELMSAGKRGDTVDAKQVRGGMGLAAAYSAMPTGSHAPSPSRRRPMPTMRSSFQLTHLPSPNAKKGRVPQRLEQSKKPMPKCEVQSASGVLRASREPVPKIDVERAIRERQHSISSLPASPGRLSVCDSDRPRTTGVWTLEAYSPASSTPSSPMRQCESVPVEETRTDSQMSQYFSPVEKEESETLHALEHQQSRLSAILSGIQSESVCERSVSSYRDREGRLRPTSVEDISISSMTDSVIRRRDY